jgi:hypothetical protein
MKVIKKKQLTINKQYRSGDNKELFLVQSIKGIEQVDFIMVSIGIT